MADKLGGLIKIEKVDLLFYLEENLWKKEKQNRFSNFQKSFNFIIHKKNFAFFFKTQLINQCEHFYWKSILPINWSAVWDLRTLYDWSKTFLNLTGGGFLIFGSQHLTWKVLNFAARGFLNLRRFLARIPLIIKILQITCEKTHSRLSRNLTFWINAR